MANPFAWPLFSVGALCVNRGEQQEGERISEADDDPWQRLTRDHASAEQSPDAADQGEARWRLEQIWNHTPNILMSNLTPAQVWAGAGGQG